MLVREFGTKTTIKLMQQADKQGFHQSKIKHLSNPKYASETHLKRWFSISDSLYPISTQYVSALAKLASKEDVSQKAKVNHLQVIQEFQEQLTNNFNEHRAASNAATSTSASRSQSSLLGVPTVGPASATPTDSHTKPRKNDNLSKQKYISVTAEVEVTLAIPVTSHPLKPTEPTPLVTKNTTEATSTKESDKATSVKSSSKAEGKNLTESESATRLDSDNPIHSYVSPNTQRKQLTQAMAAQSGPEAR
ncbi:MAG: hypothetical protein ACPGUD_11485 [Parashewanella sp.]